MIKAMFMGMRASGGMIVGCLDDDYGNVYGDACIRGDDCRAVRMMIKAMFMGMRASGGMIVGLFG